MSTSADACPGSGELIAIPAKRTIGRDMGPCPLCRRSVPITVAPLGSSAWAIVGRHERAPEAPVKDADVDPWRDWPGRKEPT
jgi:hypothetical protein